MNSALPIAPMRMSILLSLALLHQRRRHQRGCFRAPRPQDICMRMQRKQSGCYVGSGQAGSPRLAHPFVTELVVAARCALGLFREHLNLLRSSTAHLSHRGSRLSARTLGDLPIGPLLRQLLPFGSRRRNASSWRNPVRSALLGRWTPYITSIEMAPSQVEWTSRLAGATSGRFAPLARFSDLDVGPHLHGPPSTTWALFRKTVLDQRLRDSAYFR
jgi:hypothetical protein